MTSAAKKAPDIEEQDELAPLVQHLSQDEAIQELREHTQTFCEAVSGALDDFFGAQAELSGKVETQKGYCPEGNVHYSVPFSGLVNGEYIINVDEAVAAQLADCELPEEDASPEEREELRQEVGAAMCELLNTAVGTVIGDLAGHYPHLSFASPRISYGQRIYPLIRFGYSDLQTEVGDLRCHFYLDHMELDLATSYAKVRACARKAKAALVSHLEMVERILADVDIALFWVRPDGRLFKRHSKATPRLLDIEPSHLEGSVLDLVEAHLRGTGPSSSELQAWMDQAFASSSVQAWDDKVYPQCPLRRSAGPDATQLHWRWLAVRGPKQDEGVSSMLVAVQSADRADFESSRASSDLIAQLALNEWSMYDED